MTLFLFSQTMVLLFTPSLPTEKLNPLQSLYKGLYPLWGRQIPYTMVKFATFEKTVEYIYRRVLGKPKDAYNGLQQTAVSFLGGYIAGVGCAVISHPADVMVSRLNADRKGSFFFK